MTRNEVGACISIGAVVGLLAYFWLIFVSPWDILVVKITVFLGVAIVLLILGWIWSPFVSRLHK